MGAAASACLLLLAGCGSDDVAVDAPQLSGAEARTCAALVEALPDAVDGLLRRTVAPADAPAAAWGDPAIVLRCGVGRPDGFDRFSACQETNGVGWYVPRSAIEDPGSDVVMTTIDRRVRVEVTVPAQHRPPAAAMVDLAPAITQTVPQTDPCV